jgi:hypothetical protein
MLCSPVETNASPARTHFPVFRVEEAKQKIRSKHSIGLFFDPEYKEDYFPLKR